MRDGRTRIRVETTQPYDVVVGEGLLDEAARLLGVDVRRVAVVHPGALASSAGAVRDDLASHGLDASLLAVPDGEGAKTAEVLSSCWARLGQLGFTRSDALVSVGGGATTDLAGFVAATFLRGIRVVHIPTTLLAMVDAAVGGKTGINTEQGKNLVGAIHQPAGVLCDLGALRSLDRAELGSGLAEIIKCGFIADAEILRLVESSPAQATEPEAPLLRELIERSIAVKAAIVASDLQEVTSLGRQVGREALNYGHTFGHAVERVEGFRIRHGEAVAVGMVFVAALARLAGRLDDPTARRHGELLSLVGLPTSYPGGRWDDLLAAMQVDKKTRGDRLRFVVLEAPGVPAILEAPDPALLLAAYDELSGAAFPG